jgi:hypothetical protein
VYDDLPQLVNLLARAALDEAREVDVRKDAALVPGVDEGDVVVADAQARGLEVELATDETQLVGGTVIFEIIESARAEFWKSIAGLGFDVCDEAAVLGERVLVDDVTKLSRQTRQEIDVVQSSGDTGTLHHGARDCGLATGLWSVRSLVGAHFRSRSSTRVRGLGRAGVVWYGQTAGQ